MRSLDVRVEINTPSKEHHTRQYPINKFATVQSVKFSGQYNIHSKKGDILHQLACSDFRSPGVYRLVKR